MGVRSPALASPAPPPPPPPERGLATSLRWGGARVAPWWWRPSGSFFCKFLLCKAAVNERSDAAIRAAAFGGRPGWASLREPCGAPGAAWGRRAPALWGEGSPRGCCQGHPDAPTARRNRGRRADTDVSTSGRREGTSLCFLSPFAAAGLAQRRVERRPRTHRAGPLCSPPALFCAGPAD